MRCSISGGRRVAPLSGPLRTLGGILFVTTESVTAAFELFRGSVGLLVGGFVITTGIYYLAGRTTGGLSIPSLERVSGWLLAHVDCLANGPGIVALGAVHGLLPCPVLYPAYLYAFTTGSPTGGAIALAALGVGTIPTVFAYGQSSSPSTPFTAGGSTGCSGSPSLHSVTSSLLTD